MLSHRYTLVYRHISIGHCAGEEGQRRKERRARRRPAVEAGGSTEASSERGGGGGIRVGGRIRMKWQWKRAGE